jgi:hypothetical protein
MFGLEAGHVREMPLEFDLEARYAWLSQEKAEMPDMSRVSRIRLGGRICLA